MKDAKLTNLTTGYVGGTALDHIYKAHKDYDYTLLVRNEERAKPVKAKYPTAKFVYGSLDDAAVLEKAAAEADVVVRRLPVLNFAAQVQHNIPVTA